MSTVSIPPILSLLISHIAAAVPRRARITFTELLIGAAATRGGHVTDAILAAGLSRSWTTYYWLLQRGRWTWLAVWQALLRALKMLFDPPNFLVLDEPTNHLDMATKEMLIAALAEFEGTMLFVSHDRHFLAALSNRVLELTPKGVHQYSGGYTEYVARTGQEAPGLHPGA